jgi:hypothetical protein
MTVSACTSMVPDPGINPPTTQPAQTDCFGVTCAGVDSCCFVAAPDDAAATAVCANALDASTLASAYCAGADSDFECRSTSDCRSHFPCCFDSALFQTWCNTYVPDGSWFGPSCGVYACITDDDCPSYWLHCAPLIGNGVTLPFGTCQ